MTMITPSYLGETIEYSSLHACRSTLEDPTLDPLADDSSDDGLTGNERDIVKDAAREKAAEKRPDPLLRESASILADAVNLLANDRPLSAQVLPQSTGAGRWAD